jgi:general secretion pathway protein D
MVKDGQTIAIGGMVSETRTKYKNKVPVLGDIPLLGQLFTKTEDGIETTDLLIFTTVRLVKEGQDDKALLSETEKKEIRPE